MERELLKLDASIEQNLLGLDASSPNIFKECYFRRSYDVYETSLRIFLVDAIHPKFTHLRKPINFLNPKNQVVIFYENIQSTKKI